MKGLFCTCDLKISEPQLCNQWMYYLVKISVGNLT